jgi:acyl-homoserine-lactone acylase
MFRVLLVLICALSACKKSDEPEQEPKAPDPYNVQVGPYEVDIRWTEFGIPHVLSDNFGGIGYGMGYAHARDHVCTLADQIVKVRSERSKYFGPGEDDAHLDSDFGWLGLDVFRQSEAGFLTLPEDLQDGIVGYAAGFNRYVEEVGGAGLPEVCRDAAWVKPISHIDLLAYYLHLGQFGSGYALVAEVGNASPPSRRARKPPPPVERLNDYKNPPIGSNGWAIGSDKSASGRGMVLSNTHFPAEGERQWWESHLTIPGELNVYGASLIGVPLVNIGFNEHVAWTHTVSNTPRFIVYQLELDPEDPTRYFYDGAYLDMERKAVSIEVLQSGGETTEVERTLYRSRWGPIFNAPVIGWTPLNAYTWRDVNDNNLNLSATWAAMNKSDSMASFEAAHREYQGIPWVHTLMADDEGNALYLDSAATPNLSEAAEAAYESYVETDVIAGLFADFGVIVVRGSDPVNTWIEDERAQVPGAVPYDECPRLLRRDFVNNSNDNHWLANPNEPLTGYPMVYGETGTPRTPRNRMNNRMLLEQEQFDLETLESTALSARSLVADDLLGPVVLRCAGVTEVTVELDNALETIDVSEACEILSQWDGTSGVDSVGAHIWRELIGSERLDLEDLFDEGQLYGDAFSSTDPIYTPRTLADGDAAMEALASGVFRLQQAGLALDAKLGDVQFRRKDRDIPTLGGPYLEGVISVASWEEGANTTLLPKVSQSSVINEQTGLTDEGYLVNAGNSWVMAMSFEDDGPRARAILVYSQSEDPDSPHYSDQSDIYAQSTLRPILFTEAEIAADSALMTVHLSLE